MIFADDSAAGILHYAKNRLFALLSAVMPRYSGVDIASFSPTRDDRARGACFTLLDCACYS